MKRAQVPLIIIALAIGLLAYVYFLPLSEKCKIMNLPECNQLGDKIFVVYPGVLENKENIVHYTLPDVELFTVGGIERNVLAERIEVKKGWFSSYSPKMSFNIHEKSKDVIFFVYMGSGKAKVKLNGMTIAKVEGAGQHNIVVSSEKLKKSNSLEIYPYAPFFFWQVKKLEIGKIISEETYTVTQEKINQQLEIKEDIKDVQEATLSFRADCFLSEENISIIANNSEIVNDRLCNFFSKDITPIINKKMDISYFSKGNYFLYDIKVDLNLKETNWPTYYFDLFEKQKSHILKLNFTGTEEKKLTVYVNEKSFAIETSDNLWQNDIVNYLKLGQNKIVIIPEKLINVESLEIY